MNPNCLEMVHETIDNFYANQKEEREENENKKTEERAIPEESEDAQDFELLIETSFEPLIDDLTSDLIIREQIDDNVNDELDDELDDPDNCPVKCICGFNHLEQQTIFCEKCRIWKHIKCLKAEKYANSEAEYCCPECLGKSLPLSPSEAQDLVSKSLKLEHIDFKNKQCTELKLSGALQFEWKALLENSVDYKTSKVGRLIHEGKMRWAVIKKGQAGRVLAGFGIKAGDAVIGVNGIATYMMDAKNYCTCYRNLNLSFLPEPIIIEMKGRNGGLAHEVLPSCNPNCEIKFCLYKNNLYCYLAALCEIDNDDELTIAFPDTDHLHVNCAESSSNCSNTCPSQKSSKKSKIHASVVKEPPSKKLKRV
uniref:Zinc finger PHD-type domain-containing protein n=1 Tax=Panagrolaimus superbus TaxID=310955 RepID=A0A914Y4G1_9BILA